MSSGQSNQEIASPASPRKPQIFLSNGNKLQPGAKEIEDRKLKKRLLAAQSLVQRELRVLQGFHNAQQRYAWDISRPQVEPTVGREYKDISVPLPTTKQGATKENHNAEAYSSSASRTKTTASQIPHPTVSLVGKTELNVEPIRKDLGETKVALQQLLEVQRVQQREMGALRRMLQQRQRLDDIRNANHTIQRGRYSNALELAMHATENRFQ